MFKTKPVRRRAPQTPYAHIEITHNGKTMPLRDWADELKVSYQALLVRYKRGARGDDLFKTMRDYKKHIEYQGETLTVSEWSRKIGIPVATLIRRRERGDEGDWLFRPLGDTVYARRMREQAEKWKDEQARRKALADAIPSMFDKPAD